MNNIEKNIMNNPKIQSNARKALEQYKVEIGSFDKEEVPYLGGLATRKLVQMGEEMLINKYQK